VHFTGLIKSRATQSAILCVLLVLLGTAAHAAPQRELSRFHHKSPGPSITTEPVSRTVTAGQTATFSVAAVGAAPLTFQWRQNGTAISGATSSTYTTAATTTSENAAKFTVVVRNSAGSATSTAATLTVNAAATALLNSSSTSVVFGSVNVSTNYTQNVTLTNAGNSSVTISNVVVAGAGFNASGGVLGLILSPGQTAALTATFDPSAAGSATGTIAVTSNATNSPLVIVLSGTGLAQVAHSVALSWIASTSAVTGYNVYSGAVSGGPYAKVTSAPVAETDFTDSNVQAGQTYYFVVTAVNSQSQESAYSAQVSAAVP
jgi:hypothetical protein